ncbi:hypothetical protein V9K67_00780 [Paraflavisolibacter sp. H34]|uniref:hypothetical protein n=1 Tax=Huijunlia imazamoxiresistens TaxID=3127457 RepID=UPI0030187F02
MDRSNLLKSLGVTLGATFLNTDLFARVSPNAYSYALPAPPQHLPLAKQASALTLGAGNRGNIYGILPFGSGFGRI